MHLQFTKKMIDWVKPNLVIKDTDNDLHAWHVNYQIVNRKKFVIIMNDLTRFTVVLYGVKIKDLKSVDLVFNFIYHALLQSGYDEDKVNNYLKSTPYELTYGKTKDRFLVARLNRVMEDALNIAYGEGINFEQLEQTHLTEFVNNMIVGENNFKITYVPLDKMREYLEMF